MKAVLRTACYGSDAMLSLTLPPWHCSLSGAFIVPVGRYLSITAEAGVAIPQTFDIDVTHHKKNKVSTTHPAIA